MICLAMAGSAAERILAAADSILKSLQHDLEGRILGKLDHEHAGLHTDEARIRCTCHPNRKTFRKVGGGGGGGGSTWMKCQQVMSTKRENRKVEGAGGGGRESMQMKQASGVPVNQRGKSQERKGGVGIHADEAPEREKSGKGGGGRIRMVESSIRCSCQPKLKTVRKVGWRGINADETSIRCSCQPKLKIVRKAVEGRSTWMKCPLGVSVNQKGKKSGKWGGGGGIHTDEACIRCSCQLKLKTVRKARVGWGSTWMKHPSGVSVNQRGKQESKVGWGSTRMKHPSGVSVNQRGKQESKGGVGMHTDEACLRCTRHPKGKHGGGVRGCETKLSASILKKKKKHKNTPSLKRVLISTAFLHAHTHTHTPHHTHINTHTHTQIHIHTHYTHKHTHTNKHSALTHTNTHTHKHTHTNTLPFFALHSRQHPHPYPHHHTNESRCGSRCTSHDASTDRAHPAELSSWGTAARGSTRAPHHGRGTSGGYAPGCRRT